MKHTYWKKMKVFAGCVAVLLIVIFVNACSESKLVTAKSGAQLWTENCQRCHNLPPPNAFSNEQWKTIGLHMQSRALLTTKERDKIIAFLQQTN